MTQYSGRSEQTVIDGGDVFYSPEQIDKIHQDFDRVTADLQALMFRGIEEAQGAQSDDARKYLRHGVGRRLSILKRSIEDIYEIFPPTREDRLSRDEVTSVQIFLHAFVINLSGVFDNWAWAFVHRHDLLAEVGGAINVGVFKRSTQQFLSVAMRTYLNKSAISDWHEQYVKNYRDALAHRIPLYVPPAHWTEDDQANHDRLEAEKARLIAAQDWDQLDVVWNEQDQIGAPCFVFMYEYAPDENAQSVVLHPQILCDGLTVVDFGNKFYDSWDVRDN